MGKSSLIAELINIVGPKYDSTSMNGSDQAQFFASLLRNVFCQDLDLS